MSNVHPLPKPEMDSDDGRPWVPPGDYELRFVYYETRPMFKNNPKVAVYFTILNDGQHYGVKLARWYNAESLTTKPRKSGGFVARPGSDLLNEYCRVIGEPRRPRRDRVPLVRFGQYIVIGRVDAVKNNARRKSYASAMQYSVIRELLGAKTL